VAFIATNDVKNVAFHVKNVALGR